MGDAAARRSRPRQGAAIDTPDILIPLGRGSRYGDAELRFALRAIERHAQGYRGVVVVGDDPGFLSDAVDFLPCNELNANKAARIANKISYAIEHGDLTPQFALWNDDYVLLRDIDARNLAPFHLGPLEARVPECGKDYAAMLVNTARRLDGEGLATLDFDAHAPALLNAAAFADMGEWWDESRRGPGLLVKSSYFNWNPPAKLLRADDPRIEGANGANVDEWVLNRWMLSCTDTAFARGLLPWLLARFPERSAFERR